jgi:tetratricopeptide (TPR) repeat protein
MKFCLKHIFVISLLILTISGRTGTITDKSKTIDRYEQQRKYYKNKIQQYWNIAPDTSVLLADSAIELARKEKSKKDISYFLLLKGVSYYYLIENSNAVKTIKESLKENVLDDRFTSSAYTMLSLAYRNLGNYDTAIYYSKKALRLREEKIKDTNDIAGSYDNMSTIYFKAGEFDSAINYSLKAAKLFEKTGNKKELAYTWSNLSSIYDAVGNKNNSYHYLMLAYNILKNEGNDEDIVRMLENLGDYFLNHNMLDSAQYYFNQAVSMLKKMKKYDDYANTKRALGEIFLKLGKNSKAEKELTEANKLFKKSDRMEDIIITEVLVAEVELRKGNFTKAKNLLDNALTLENRMDSERLRLKILKEKEKLMEQWGHHAAAWKLYHQIETLKDTLYKKELKSKLEEITTKYQTEKIKYENRKLKQQHKIERMKTKQMRILFFISVFTAFLLAIIFLLILQKRQRNILLHKQELNIAKKEEALIKAELQNAELKKQELSKENDFRSRQLTTFTLHLMQKNLILQDMLKKVKEIERKDARQIKKELVNLKIQLINAISSDSDWENFKLFFEKVNANFFTRLKEKYPNLSSKDEKLCALIKLNMDINETASVLNVDYNTVRIARYRLKKKMELAPDEDLNEVIGKI